MKKMQTKHSGDQCQAFENFMIDIGQWKPLNWSIVQTWNFKTADEIEYLWKKKISDAKATEKQKQKNTQKIKVQYQKKQTTI
jgi:hypothetical protein